MWGRLLEFRSLISQAMRVFLLGRKMWLLAKARLFRWLRMDFIPKLGAVRGTEPFRIGGGDEDFAVVILEVGLAVSERGGGTVAPVVEGD